MGFDMFKNLMILTMIIITTQVSFASEFNFPGNEKQNQIDKIGYNIINKNRITNRVIFTYDKNHKKTLLKTEKNLRSRNIVLYKNDFSHIEDENDLAAFISNELVYVLRSYEGPWNGNMSIAKTKLSPKKFETYSDKVAVDILVNAGYNPAILIIYLNKTYPQKSSDRLSKHNLTSKRMARVYEYILLKYPNYLSDKTIINNKYYQNFLLTSIHNRKLAEQQVRYHYNWEPEYE